MADESESERTDDPDAQDAPADDSSDEAERAAEQANGTDSDHSGSTETDDETTPADGDGDDAPEADEGSEAPASGTDDDDSETDSDDTGDDTNSDGDDTNSDGDDTDDHSGSTETDTDGDAADESGSLQQVSADRGDDAERPPEAADEADDDADGDAHDNEEEDADDDEEDAEAADDDTNADDEDEDTDDDPDYVEDASIDEDAFPVAGMTAEEAQWDPESAVGAEELGPEEKEIEPLDDDQRTESVGVQPEKQEIDDSIWGEGPDSDQEMPLADHIEEMMRRLGVVFVISGAVSLIVLGLAQTVEWLPTAVDIIDVLWNHNIPGAPENAGRRPRVYGPLELVLTKLKVAGLAGILVGLPAFVYETYLFMRPGLYPRERKYYLAAVPTSLILAAIGMTFAHFVVLPTIFDYFTSYTEGTATIAFGLSETFNLIILLMGYMAIVFQIPLFIMLAIMMNLVTRIWLEDKRLLFWGAFAGLAFLVSPDPTGMAPIIIAATMIVLYEGTLALLRWTGN